MGMAFYAISKRNLKEKHDERGENRKIKREMSGEAPVLAGVSKAATSDVEAARLRDDAGNDKNHHERSQNRQRPEVKVARDQR